MTENPVRLLFVAIPAIVRFLHGKADHLFEHRELLQELSTPTLDANGLRQLRGQLSQLFPGEDPVRLCPDNLIQKLYDQLSSAQVFPSVDDTVYFQVGLILVRLAHDYVGARELYDAHKDGFVRSLVQVLEFNSITRDVNWESLRRRLAEVLKESFPDRYRNMAVQAGEFLGILDYRMKLS
jgi:hypothetical protein